MPLSYSQQQRGGYPMMIARVISIAFVLPFITLVLLFASATSIAQSSDGITRILVMHGVWEAGPWDLSIDRGIVDVLQLSEDSSVQVSFEYLGIDALPDADRLEEIKANIESMVVQQNVSIIVAIQPLASEFFFTLDLPDSISALLLVPSQAALELAREADDVAVVESASRSAIAATLRQIDQLRPQSETVYVVGGSNGDDIIYVNQVAELAEEYQERFNFEYLTGVEPVELERQLSQLNSADTVLSLPFSAYTSRSGELEVVGSVYLDLMIDSVPAPLFGIYDRLIGEGLTGGVLSSTEGYARTLGELVRNRIDNGEWDRFVTAGQATTFYDWQEVQRFDLDLNRLTEPYELINRPENLWQSNPILVIVFANVLLILLLVLIFMWVQLRRSRAAQLAIASSEKLARENEERYRLLATNTVDVIWKWNGRTEEVMYISPSIEKLTGYTVEEFLAKPLHKWITPESFQRCVELYNKGPMSSEQLIEIEHYTKAGGSVWCEMSVHPVYQAEEDDTWVGVTRDITQRKLEEKHRNKLEASVRQNQKFESLGTLAGGIAHDFNNVLGVMMGLIDLLADEVKSDSSSALIDKLDNSAQKAKRLVQRILTFARQKEGEDRTLNFTELVTDSIELLRSGIPPNVTLDSDIPAELIKVDGDRTQIEQIIMNVATNAIEALGETPGTLTFTLRKQSFPEMMELPHGSIEAGDYAHLLVEDDGVGISAEMIERIFDPFYTSKELGSGMGLAIVRNIVIQHRGAINL